MGVNGELNTPAVSPRGNNSLYPLDWRFGGQQSQLAMKKRKISASDENRILSSSPWLVAVFFLICRRIWVNKQMRTGQWVCWRASRLCCYQCSAAVMRALLCAELDTFWMRSWVLAQHSQVLFAFQPSCLRLLSQCEENRLIFEDVMRSLWMSGTGRSPAGPPAIVGRSCHTSCQRSLGLGTTCFLPGSCAP
jgi:hypothetical protein